MNFNEAMDGESPHIKFRTKKQYSGSKTATKEISREQKNIIQEHWEDRDVAAVLGIRQSFNQRANHRMAFSESKQEAVERTNSSCIG